MTYMDIQALAKKLDDKTKKRIDKEVQERIKILEDGKVDQENIDEVEECLYVAFVLQEFLSGKYEMLEEERLILLAEMEDLYNTYVDLLARAKIEEKLSKKKRMALELMQIREQLFGHKETMKDIDMQMKETKKTSLLLDNVTSKRQMTDIVKENRELKEKTNKLELDNIQQENKLRDLENSRDRSRVETREDINLRPRESIFGEHDNVRTGDRTDDKLDKVNALGESVRSALELSDDSALINLSEGPRNASVINGESTAIQEEGKTPINNFEEGKYRDFFEKFNNSDRDYKKFYTNNGNPKNDKFNENKLNEIKLYEKMSNKEKR